jgi:predicted CXXCH cytochrome family protein
MCRSARIAVACLFTVLIVSVAPGAYASTESTYAVWDIYSVLDHSVPHDTPHRDYATTTTKCAVCHAVHKAPSDGELLLRDTVSESCVYCHVDSFVGGIRIYNGQSSLYYDDNKKNHSRAGDAPCSGCHSVHGANTYGTALATKILKRLPIQPEFVRLFSETDNPNVLYEASAPGGIMYAAGPYAWEDWGYARGVQQTAFCTGCHPYYTRNDGTDPIEVEGVHYNAHPMKRFWNGVETRFDADGKPIVDGNGVPVPFTFIDFEAPGSTLPHDTRVAGMSTNGCYHCHGEQAYENAPSGVTQESSFPHYTANRERFLVSGDGINIDMDTPDSTQDGTCLQCHLWGSDGVGATY